MQEKNKRYYPPIEKMGIGDKHMIFGEEKDKNNQKKD